MTTPASETPTTSAHQAAGLVVPDPVEPTPTPAEPADHTGVTVNDPSGVTPLPTGDFAPAEPPAEDTADEPVKWEHPEGWNYDWLDFKGDRLAIRVPNGAALNALNMAQSKKVTDARRAEMTRNLLSNHLSADSFDRVFFDRSADPDEPDYDVNTLGALLSELITLAGDRITAELDALNGVTK